MVVPVKPVCAFESGAGQMAGVGQAWAEVEGLGLKGVESAEEAEERLSVLSARLPGVLGSWGVGVNP